jgi:hypothetical protein
MPFLSWWTEMPKTENQNKFFLSFAQVFDHSDEKSN